MGFLSRMSGRIFSLSAKPTTKYGYQARYSVRRDASNQGVNNIMPDTEMVVPTALEGNGTTFFRPLAFGQPATTSPQQLAVPATFVSTGQIVFGQNLTNPSAQPIRFPMGPF